jgi:N-acetylmuramoyl-L-alanine amidase
MIQPWLRPLRRACELAAVAMIGVVAPALAASAFAQSAPTAPFVVAAGEPAKPTVAAAAPTSAIGGDAARTRFVIGLDKPVQFQVFSLTNPNRVVVEMPDVKVSLPPHDGDKAVGLVKSFRGGVASADKMRIVIDVTEPVIVAKSEVEHGKDGKARLAIEIVPVAALDKAKGKKPTPPFALGGMVPTPTLAPAAVQPPLPMRALTPKQKSDRTYKPTIVIDPGHGGHDSGAKKNGAIEKEVVLAFGLALRDKLNATGKYKVIMTRDTDTFVELDERRAFGERANAALFIAVHADYAGSKAKGATIFSLRDGVADDLKRSTKNEVAKKVMTGPTASMVKNSAGEGDMDAVKGILEDLAKQEVEANKDRSKLFAGTVIETMSDATDMRSSPDQQAAFRVLKTAHFPSVLIELAYVTNKKDAENLKSEDWRNEVSQSIVSAVDTYFSNKLAHLPM